jgi:hypothetical protein
MCFQTVKMREVGSLKMTNSTFSFSRLSVYILMSCHPNVKFAGRTPKTEKVCSKYATVRTQHP